MKISTRNEQVAARESAECTRVVAFLQEPSQLYKNAIRAMQARIGPAD